MELLTIDNFNDFILKAPLYVNYQIHINPSPLDSIFKNHYGINAYCPLCNEVCTYILDKDSTLVLNYCNAVNAGSQSIEYYFKRLMMQISFKCSKNPDHNISVYNNITSNTIMKIGQYPKNYTFLFPDQNKYDYYLNQYAIEYKTALQVHSHGTGIGSFVYLRRVLEFLTEEYHQKAKSEASWDEELYNRERFGERVKLIEKYHQFLPDELRSYTTRIYGILSKGIHELDEDECLTLFPTMKFIIERVLDERVEEARQALKLVEALKSLSS